MTTATELNPVHPMNPKNLGSEINENRFPQQEEWEEWYDEEWFRDINENRFSPTLK